MKVHGGSNCCLKRFGGSSLQFGGTFVLEKNDAPTTDLQPKSLSSSEIDFLTVQDMPSVFSYSSICHNMPLLIV